MHDAAAATEVVYYASRKLVANAMHRRQFMAFRHARNPANKTQQSLASPCAIMLAWGF